MASRDCHGQKQRGFVLNAQTLQRVVAVGEPDPVGAREDAEIDPPAARGAAFDLHPGVRRAQPVEQRVNTVCLGRVA